MTSTMVPVAWLDDLLQSQARIDRILGAAIEARFTGSIALRNARNFLTKLGIAVQGIEHVRGGLKQVDFMRSDKGPQREWVVLDLCYDLSVLLRSSVQWQVYPDKLCMIEAQYLGPERKEAHNR